MKYKIIKSSCTFRSAAKELKNGYFIRRSWWPSGTVLLTKEDYKVIEWGHKFRNRDYETLPPDRQPVPQYWYLLSTDFRFSSSPDDVLSSDWEIVQAISMTDNERKRIKGKFGGVCMNTDVINVKNI